jgi:hypothetical protein
MTLKKCIFAAVLGICLLLTWSACGRRGDKPRILARIGDRTITVNEFEYRSELTVRPKFPARKGTALNRTLLNDLLLEKIFAMEAGKQNPLIRKERFRAFLQGIREQSMREALYRNAMAKETKVDTAELKNRYRAAGREYDVAFYTIHKKEIARQIQERLLVNPGSAADVFDELGGAVRQPRHTVRWKDPENDLIHEALFTRPVPKDTVIGPVRLDNDLYLMMKVIDWADHPAIGGEEAQIRWNEVRQKALDVRSRAAWQDYVIRRMSGMKIEFNPPVYKKLAELSYLMYTASGDSERQTISRRFSGTLNDAPAAESFGGEEGFKKQPFFTVNGKVWTVEDFQKALDVHPLVYRNRADSRSAYAAEFRYAVWDLLRDQLLTKDAYDRSLDKSDEVRRTVEWWSDAMVAQYQRDRVLEKLADRFHTAGDSRLLTGRYAAYTDSLLAAYSKRTWIDTPTLNKIELTNVDMIAYKPGVPYSLAVPGFTDFLVR